MLFLINDGQIAACRVLSSHSRRQAAARRIRENRRAQMAQGRDQQGTGRHPHKSTEEPWPHTKDEGGQHGKSHSAGGSRDRSHSSGDDNRSHSGGSHGRSQSGGRDDNNRSQAGSHG